jgi:hypothetical protein
MMRKLGIVAALALVGCQGLKTGSAPGGAPPGTSVEPQSIGIDVSWRRLIAGSPTPTRDNLMQWLASHPRLRGLADQDRVIYLNRAAEILKARGELGPVLNPSQLAAMGNWILPEGMQITTSAAVLVLGTTQDPTKDRLAIEGSDTGSDHYVGILSNIYTATPTVLKSADLGAPLADHTSILSSLDGTVVYVITSGGMIRAIKVADGTTVWSTAAMGAVSGSTPWIDFGNGVIYAVAGGKLVAINSANGMAATGWSSPTLSSGSHSSPIAFNGIVWLGDDGGRMHRFDPTSGAELGTAINMCNGSCGTNDAVWSMGFIDTDNMKFMLGVNKRLIQIDLNACTTTASTCTINAYNLDSQTFVSRPATFYSAPTLDSTGTSGHVFALFNNRLWSTSYNKGAISTPFTIATTQDPTGLFRGVATNDGYPRGIPLYQNNSLLFGDGGGFFHRFSTSTMTEQAFSNYVNSGATQSATAPAIDSTPLIDTVGGNVYFAVANPSSPQGQWVQLPQGFGTDPAPPGGTATHLRVESTYSPAAGAPFSVTISAVDASGIVATGYTGTIHFTSSDGGATLPVNYTFTTGAGGDNGLHTFSVTMKSVGLQSLTTTDTGSASITGTEDILVVGAKLVLVPSANPVAPGAPFNLTVTAEDQLGNTLTGYAGTIAFTSTDPSATLPGNYTFTGADMGTHTFMGVVLQTNGNQDIKATDTVVSATTGTVVIDVTGTPTAHFVVAAPATAAAYALFSITVTAKDASGNTLVGYTGTAHFTSSDPQAVLPADYTFTGADAGVHTFTNAVELKTGGSQWVAATDTVTASMTGFATINVTGGTVTHLLLVPQTNNPPANTAIHLYVYAKDANNVTITSYTGTVHFTSSDGSATLPADYTFTTSDGGFHAFFYGATFRTPGAQTVTVTDTTSVSIAPGTANINVTGGTVTHLSLVAQPTTVGANAPFNLFVYAKDANNNNVPSYTGTVHFTSTDTNATLPADYTFTSGDAGAHTFVSGAILRTPGTQTITVADANNMSITAGTAQVTVTGGTVTHLVLVPQTTNVPANVAIHLTVYAKDANNNNVASYTGTVHFTSTDGSATLPANYMFTAGDAGVHTFYSSATFRTPGAQTITVTDVNVGTITPGTSNITVTGGVVTHLVLLTAPTNVAAGSAFHLFVYARDSNNNNVPSFTDTVHFVSSDGAATLPANYMFTAGDAGAHTFYYGATLRTIGGQTITVSDVTNPAVTSGTANVTVH